ncbi:sensor histidine kinase [Microbacterium karelineae]|uniref:sensor histidine kinase n=1 Tax=Microbacterium karelineae TaxID=2654283 RepID=UPI0012E9C54E|nr:histidine kinase [Microbacterium karelineae]
MSPSTPASPVPPPGPGEASAVELPRPPGVFRRWIDHHPRAIDALIAIVAVIAPHVLLVIALGSAPEDGPRTIVVSIIGTVVLTAGVMLRRRWPFLLLVLALGVSAASSGNEGAASGAAAWVALYSLGVFAGVRRAWIGFGIAAAASFVLMQFDADRAAGPWWALLIADVLQVGAAFVIPTLVGLWIGGRRRYEHALIARAEDLARERDQRARLAVSEERTRIAREMHDIVSHSLTVMITLSEGAAAQAEVGSDRAPDAMRRVADTGRESLAEMRRLLGVLRSPDTPAEFAPQPGADSLSALIAQFRDAGMPVTWRSEGEPLASGGVALTTYRIVQESLTNVLRHAPGSPAVAVSVRNRDGRVTITVDSDLTRDPLPSDGDGRGLVGMRERAALHGGEVVAGPRPDGRWRVRATLLLDPPRKASE